MNACTNSYERTKLMKAAISNREQTVRSFANEVQNSANLQASFTEQRRKKSDTAYRQKNRAIVKRRCAAKRSSNQPDYHRKAFGPREAYRSPAQPFDHGLSQSTIARASGVRLSERHFTILQTMQLKQTINHLVSQCWGHRQRDDK